MRWRLILKEFGPEIKHIKGENNAVADALFRLEMSDNQEILNISDLYVYDEADLPDSAYPIRYHRYGLLCEGLSSQNFDGGYSLFESLPDYRVSHDTNLQLSFVVP